MDNMQKGKDQITNDFHPRNIHLTAIRFAQTTDDLNLRDALIREAKYHEKEIHYARCTSLSRIDITRMKKTTKHLKYLMTEQKKEDWDPNRT